VVIGRGTVSRIKSGTVNLHMRLSRVIVAKLRRLRRVTLRSGWRSSPPAELISRSTPRGATEPQAPSPSARPGALSWAAIGTLRP
jgi:hypothetical protein